MAGLRRVWLRSLTLADFRNYAELSLALGREAVAFVGPNGAGKTNLLEAVSVLSPGRGLRRATYDDMVRQGAAAGPGGAPPGWTVAADVVREEAGGEAVPVRVGSRYAAAPGETRRARRIRIDGADAAADDLLAVLVVLWLTPAMDGLFTGAEADRRRFLDRMTLALFPDHGRHASAYEKAMRQRNRLLEEGGGVAAWLDAVEAELARHGAAMAAARATLVERLDGALERAGTADFPRAHLALSGDLETLAAGTGTDGLEEALRQAWRDGRRRDEAAGRTLLGPHRTALAVTHVDKAMPADKASTGEQKALLIQIVLAHAELTASATGEAPVLLLDEVAAHLDPDRRAALFSRLERLGAQPFMTGTDAHLFEAIADRALVLPVAAGRVAR